MRYPSKPAMRLPYPMTKRLPALRRALEDQLLEPGAGAHALPVYLVATKDAEIRFCPGIARS